MSISTHPSNKKFLPSVLKLVAALFLLPAGLAVSGSVEASTFFVRTDGGDASQCTGRGDTAYPGSGTAQDCAWKHPYYALPSSGAARIAGGDTLLIGAGEYMIGFGAPGATCGSGDRTSCTLGKIPSGTTAAKTRILGNASTPPKLWGAEGTWSIINLNGSSNVEIGSLEITDKSDCVSEHSSPAAACKTSAAPYGNWAAVGVSASASGNVWLHDLNIHGLADRGIRGGGLSNWTLERVKINANGLAGWEGDIGASSSNSGQMVFRDVEIAWNGCGERWQTGVVWACWAQQAGGYGDGLGTAKTGGQWLIEDSFIHHNTSDGLDLLYLDGAAGTSVTIRRTLAVGNAGNQLKTTGAALIENSVVVGNCAYFNGKDSMVAGDHCRAEGDAIAIALSAGQSATLRHNTITGEGNCLVTTEGGTSASKMVIQNNTIVGQPKYNAASTLTCGHYSSSVSPVTFTGNSFWNIRSSCPAGSQCAQNPKLTNMVMASFDATPLAGSPLIDNAPPIAGVDTDFLLYPRPSGPAPDIGAIEVQVGGTPPPPSPPCARTVPTISLEGPAAAVAAGTKVIYTVTLTNKDSAACSNTSFNLARTVPVNWTGTLSTTSVNLAPGASSSSTLSVTSASGSAAGAYGIGVGVSSIAHTANASTTYTVAAGTTPPPSGGGLTETVGTNKTTYLLGEKVYMSARVLIDGQPVSGAIVRFSVTRPNGNVASKNATSGTDGYARNTVLVGTGSGAIGNYSLRAVATSGTKTAAATSSFNARR